MTVTSWKAATSGDWSDASMWSGIGAPPDAATADAVIAASGAYTVTLPAGEGFVVNSLALADAGAKLDLNGLLTLTGSRSVSVTAGTLVLTGTLTHAIVSRSGGDIGYAGGTLAAATLLGTLDLGPAGSAVSIVGGILLTGASGSGPGAASIDNGSTLSVAGSTTLDHATITIGASGTAAAGALIGTGSDAVLTLGSHLTVIVGANATQGADLADGGQSGDALVNVGTIDLTPYGNTAQVAATEITGDSFVNSGLIEIGAGDTLDIDSDSFSNTGTITIDGDASLVIGSGTVTNSGLISITGGGSLTLSNLVSNIGAISIDDTAQDSGALTIAGDNTTAWGSGSISVTNAVLVIQGAISTANLDAISINSLPYYEIDANVINTGTTLDATGASNFSTYPFEGTITGGVILGDNVAFDFGTFVGVTYRGSLTVAPFHNFAGAQVAVEDGITLTDASGTGAGSVSVTADGTFYVEGTTTLDHAIISLAGAAINPLTGGVNYNVAALQGDALTLGSGLIVQDAPTEGDGAPGGGEILAGTLINRGLILGDIDDGYMTIAGGTLTNAGTISITEGDTLSIQSTVWTNLQSTTLTGGDYVVGDGSQLQLLTGGPIATLDADISLGSAASLESYSVATASFTPLESMLTTIGAAGTLHLLDGRGYSTTTSLTDNGLLVLDGGTFTSGGTLVIGAGGTLEGHGEIAVPIASDGTIIAEGGNLILDDALTGGGSVTIDAGAKLTLDGNATIGAATVAGTLQAATNGDTVEIDGIASNSGTITFGNSDNLTLAGTAFSNSGSVSVTGGGALLLSNLKANSGAISVIGDPTVGGELYLSGDNTTPWGNGSISANNIFFGFDGLISTQNFNSLLLPSLVSAPSLDGTIVNTGAVLNVIADVNFSTYAGVTVLGGVIEGDNASWGAGILDGVTYRGSIQLVPNNPIGDPYIDGGIEVRDGTVFTNAAGTGPGSVTVTSGTVFADNSSTLDNATIFLQGAGFYPNGYYGYENYEAALQGETLTLGPHLLVEDGPSGFADEGGIPGGVLQATTLVNLGTIDADSAGGFFAIYGTRFLNQGLINVTNGDALYVDVTQWANLIGTKLSSGNYFVGAGSVLQATSDIVITSLAATLTLSGSGSEVETFDYYQQYGSPATTPAVLLETTLTTIDAAGKLQLLGGRGYTTTNILTDNGLLVLDGGTFTSGGTLVIGAGGTLFGHGEIAVPIANAGTIIADGGTLTLDDDLTGGGLVTVDAGATLRLLGSDDSGAVSVAGTLALGSGASLTIGGNLSSNSGLISATDTGNLDFESNSLRNSGTITVSGGSSLTLSNLASNTGVISVDGGPYSDGGLVLDGDNTTAWGGGSFTLSYAHLIVDGRISTANLTSIVMVGVESAISGDIVNTGATLDVTGSLNFLVNNFYGTITGGVIDGDGVTFGGGTFDGVTYRGALTIAQFHFGVGYITAVDGITLTDAAGTGRGSVTVTSGTQFSDLGTTTLDNATIFLQGAALYPDIEGDPSGISALIGNTLTLGAHLLVEDQPSGLEDEGYRGGGLLQADTLINQGTISADTQGGFFGVYAGRFTNHGLISVTHGDVLFVDANSWTNLLGTTLSVGSYVVGAGSLLQMPSSIAITTLAATLTLSGAGSAVESLDYIDGGASGIETTTPVLLDSTLTTIATPGMLRLEAGRGFATSHAITDNGTLFISGGTFRAAELTIGATGTLLGTALIAAPIANAGTIESSGGLLTLAGGVSGAGTLRVDAGSKMVLPADTTAASLTVAGTLNLLGATARFGTANLLSSGRLLGLGVVTNTVANAGTIESNGGLLTLVGGVTGGGAIVIDAGSKLNARATATAGTLTDAGTLQLDGHTVAVSAALITATGLAEGFGSFLGPIADGGTIEATGGRLSLGAVTGAGALLIGPGATLELTQATSHDVSFAGAAGTLALDAPAGFSGIIRGLLVGDSLVFKNELISSASVQPGLRLQVTGNTGTFEIGLAGVPPNTEFAISADRHGLTLAHV